VLLFDIIMQMNYIEMNQRFQKYKKVIVTLNQWITYVFYILYPLALLYLFLNRKELLVRSILVPGCSFILLSFIRKKIARKRPYEIYAFKPLIEKETKANSMPSRHVFSACLIAMVCLEINTTFGCVLLFLALISAVLRVIGGVHFVSDVVAGYITGIVCGILLFL
jgi:membrane-associated phospholipid phosphatase